MIRDFSDIYSRLKDKKPKTAVIAAADDEDVLSAVKAAEEKKLIVPVLIGDRSRISEALDNTGYNFSGRIVDEKDNTAIAETAVKMISSSKAAAILVKGFIPSSVLLKAVLNREWGLRSGHLLCLIG